MKRRKQILALLMAASMAATPVLGADGLTVKAKDDTYAGEEWYDQIEIVEENREAAKAFFTPYESAAKALANEKSVLDEADETDSKWYQTLNGEWDFKFAAKPADREKKVTGEATKDYVEDWDTTGWDKIQVPSSIQAIKDEDGNFKYEKPIYVNQRFPWANYESVNYHTNGKNKPVAPTVNNSVGHYKRTFTLPKDWDGRQTFVSFQGVESAYYLYVNGQRVGYAEDSYTADDFNITECLKPGENTIAVELYRWSTGSYLENQDFIRMSGIFRDVFLYSKDDVELRDFFVKTDLDDNYENATLTLDADIRSLNPEVSGTYTVKASLYDDADMEVWEEPLTFDVEVEAGKTTVEERADDKGTRGTASKEVINPKKWFADTPNLYRLLIELVDAQGNVIETACQRVGFREISKVDINEEEQEQAQINGKKIMFRGTNRHETDDQVGRALTKEDIITDLKTMKQFNVNAIRTSHYPNHPYTYALADELGLYMCDEANVESHQGSFADGADLPSGEPVWNKSVMDRTINMVERDKNHASVVIWSLGNEATYSTHAMDENYCFYNSTSWILERDPSRLRKYERDNRYTKGDRANSMVDIHSTQYWGVSSVEGYVANKNNKAPYIQSEYAHAMGNGLGNFKEYWDVFRNYPNGQGGFIWDWIDQSISTKIENTSKFYLKMPDGSTADVKGALVDGMNGNKALDGEVIVPNVSANSAGITIGAWVKWDGVTGKDQAIVSKGDDSYNLKITSADNGKIEFFVDGWKSGVLRVEFPEQMRNGEWTYLAGTYADGKYAVYADGVKLGEKAISKGETVDTTSHTIGIGQDPQYGGRAFNGNIGGVHVYNRALTAEELKGDYVPAAEEAVYVMNFTEDDYVEENTGYPEGTYFGYGGNWGETVTDNDFCANGLMNADRTPSAELYEVKKVHQEISFYDDGKAKDGEVRIVNEFLNTNLNKYDVSWKLINDAVVLAEGTLTEEQKDIPAGSEAIIHLDLPTVAAVEGADYILEFGVTLKEDQKWAGDYYGKAGDEIAYEQFTLNYDEKAAQPQLDVTDCESIKLTEDDTTAVITGGSGEEAFSVIIDKATGYITNYTVGGEVLLKDGPKPNYWRARISNDPNFTDGMKEAAKNFQVESCDIVAKDKVVSVHVDGIIEGIDSPNSIDYMIYANGDIVVTNSFTPKAGAVGDIARIGMRMVVPEGYENVTYYGRGPWENYIDRKSGAKIGVYKDTVTDMFEEKYVRPQENGNRTDVRWTALTNGENGKGIMIAAEEGMETSALHYTAEDIHKVWSNFGHAFQIPKTEDIVLTVDYAQRGLGNASCGPGPLGKYIIGAGKTYTHSFRITPITKESADDAAFVNARMENSNLSTANSQPLSGITLDGVALKGFSDAKKEYTRQLFKQENQKFPVVDAVKTSDKVKVEIVQATEANPTATIKATTMYGFEEVYTVNFELIESEMYVSDMDWLIDKGGYFSNTRDVCGCGQGLGVYVDGTLQNFEKGVSLHAPAEVTIDVEGMRAGRFTAIAGINTCQPSRGLVNIVVKLDGKEVFRQDDVGARQSVPIDIDLTGAKTVSLITEMGENDGNDHTTWADAKIIAAPEVPAEADDKEDLAALITYAEGEAKKAEYKFLVPAVKNAFEAALTKATEVRDKEDATQAEVDKAYGDLLKLVQMLDFTGNDTKLEDLVKYANGLTESLYTTSTWKVLATARTDAQNIVDEPNSLQAEIDEARVALRNAIFGLRLIPDKGQLEGLIKSAEAINTANYTVKSATAFAAALEHAKAVFADGEATEEDVKSAEKALEEAQKNLVAKEDVKEDADKAAEKDVDKEAGSKADSDAAGKDDNKVVGKEDDKANHKVASDNGNNKVASDDGSKKADSKSAAKTGDAGAAMPAAMAGLAALLAVVVSKKRKSS